MTNRQRRIIELKLKMEEDLRVTSFFVEGKNKDEFLKIMKADQSELKRLQTEEQEEK